MGGMTPQGKLGAANALMVVGIGWIFSVVASSMKRTLRA
jgi:hypothetical protein